MATTSREQLKAWFRKGLKPLESQFAAWLDSYWHKSDSIPMSSIDGLNDALNDRTVIADDTLDTTSTNPIQNAPVATALEGKSDIGHTHTPADITGLETAIHNATTTKQDKSDNTLATSTKTVVGAINEVADNLSELANRSRIHTYTLDFGTGGELIQDANMLGAATITRILTRNVARLFLTNDQGVRQEISLTGTLSIAVPADDILTWEIARTNDDELACVGIKCELTAD